MLFFRGKKNLTEQKQGKGSTPLNTEQSAVVPILVMHLAHLIGLQLFNHLILYVTPVGKLDIL